MKPKISQLIHSLAAALLALAAPFAASAEVVEGHPKWTYNFGGQSLTSNDGWTINKVTYSGGILTFFFHEAAGGMPKNTSKTVLDFTNLPAANGLSQLFSLNNAASELYHTKVENVTKIILPPAVTELGSFVFCDFTELVEVSGLENIKRIGQQAFYRDAKFSTLTGNPDLSNLESVKVQAFSGCALKSVSFKDAPLTTLPDSVFSGCKSLLSVRIPAGLTTLGKSAFEGCSSLVTVDVWDGDDQMLPNTLSSMGDSCFEGASALQGTFNSALLTRIPERAFAGAGSENAGNAFVFKAGAALESVGPSAFEGAGLTSIDFTAAKNLTAIAEKGFKGCSSLTTITPLLPDQLTSFGASAFEGCSAVTGTLSLDGKGYVFGNRAFYGWDSLTSLVLGTDILNLPDETFATAGASPQLMYITFSAPDMRELNDNIFIGQKNVKELTLAALHLRTPGQAFAPFTILDTVHWQGAVPYGLTTDPFPNRESGKITINVSGASWSRKESAAYPLKITLDPDTKGQKPELGTWYFSADRYQNTNNTDPQTAEGSYSVPIGDSNESVKIDDDWLKAKGQTPSDKTATENWLKGGTGEYKNWMAYVLGNAPGDKVVITSDAAKDTDTGVTIKLGNVADFRDAQAEIPGRPKADECYVSTKFQLMKWDYQNSKYVPEGAPSESTEFTLPFDACTPAARYTVSIAFTADSKTIFVDAVDAVYFYSGKGQTIPVPGVDPADGVSITYSFDRDSGYSTDLPTMKDVGEKTVYIKVTKPEFADASAEAKLTILQADNSWKNGPSIEPDSWQDSLPPYTLTAVPEFGSPGDVLASLDGAAEVALSSLNIEEERGIHTIKLRVPEPDTHNYRELTGEIVYSIDTFYTCAQDDASEHSFSVGKWTTATNGVTSATVSVNKNYDYVILPGAQIRTDSSVQEPETFAGNKLTLKGGQLALKMNGGGTKTVKIPQLVIDGDNTYIGSWDNKYILQGNFSFNPLNPNTVLLVGSPSKDYRSVEFGSECTVSGPASSHIRLNSGFGSSNAGGFGLTLTGDFENFKGVLDSEDTTINTATKLTISGKFGGKLGQLSTTSKLTIYLSQDAVGTSGIPVEGLSSFLPSCLHLDGAKTDWRENTTVLTYPANTPLSVEQFTQIPDDWDPAVITLPDGSVALVVRCNMPKLELSANSPDPVTYDGEEHGLADLPTVDPEEAHATLAYLESDGETWTEFDELEDLPTFTEAGDHVIQLRAVANGYQTAFGSASVRISKATGSWGSHEPSISPTDWTKDDQSSLNISFGTPSLEVYDTKYATERGSSFYDYEKDSLAAYLLDLSAGSYTVMFTAESTNPNYEVLTKAIPITITPKFTVTIETSWADFTYDGTTHTLAAAVVRKDGKEVPPSSLEYQVDGGSWTTSRPQLTDAKTYAINVKAVVEGVTEQISRSVTVNRKGIAKPTVVTGLVYNGTTKTGVNSGTGYSLTGHTAVDAGAYTAKATPDGNYCWSDLSGEEAKMVRDVEWSIAKATPIWTTDPSISKPSWKVGESAGVLSLGVVSSGGALSSSMTQAQINAITEPDDYIVTVTAAATVNYDSISANVGFTVNPEGPTTTPVTIKGGSYNEIGSGDDVETVFIFTDPVEGQTFQLGAKCNADLLVVGGGAGGTAGWDSGMGGGGGGGQVASASYDSLDVGTYAITVGAGGAGGQKGSSASDTIRAGKNGGQSSFGSLLTAAGGKGHEGESGTGSFGSGGANGDGTHQGGGSGDAATHGVAGGGGGAHESGYNGTHGTKPGYGGEGESSSITGTPQVYGSGGGAGVNSRGAASAGKGGTNAGSGNRNGQGINAVPGFGGGGGGGGPVAGASSHPGGAGGSGTVIIRVKGKCEVIWTPARTAYYKVGDDPWGTTSFDKSYSSGSGWSTSEGGTVDTSHYVASENQYIIPAGAALGADNNNAKSFKGVLLLNGGSLVLTATEELRAATINRFTVQSGSIKLSSQDADIYLKGSLTVAGSVDLVIADADRGGKERLKIMSRLTGNGTIAIQPPKTSIYQKPCTVEILGDASTYAGTVKLKENLASIISDHFELVISGPFGGTLGDFSALSASNKHIIYLGAGAINAGGVKVASATYLPPANIDLTADAQALSAGTYYLLSYPAGDAPADLATFTKLKTYGTLSYETVGDREVLKLTITQAAATKVTVGSDVAVDTTAVSGSTIFKFTAVGGNNTFNVTEVASGTTFDYLVVGGGGGGGTALGGGGGGGSVLSATSQQLASGNYEITVGAGGQANTKDYTTDQENSQRGVGYAGSQSELKFGGETVTAYGGGGGVGYNRFKYGPAQHPNNPSVTVENQGGGSFDGMVGGSYVHTGGSGEDTSTRRAGGGASASADGYNCNDGSNPGCGAEGVTSDITGSEEVYGSGGGGGARPTTTTSGCGLGGTNAGNGGCANGSRTVGATPATVGFGGGGGGGAGGDPSGTYTVDTTNGGAGGSGVVIIRVNGVCDVTRQ